MRHQGHDAQECLGRGCTIPGIPGATQARWLLTLKMLILAAEDAPNAAHRPGGWRRLRAAAVLHGRPFVLTPAEIDALGGLTIRQVLALGDPGVPAPPDWPWRESPAADAPQEDPRPQAPSGVARLETRFRAGQEIAGVLAAASAAVPMSAETRLQLRDAIARELAAEGDDIDSGPPMSAWAPQPHELP